VSERLVFLAKSGDYFEKSLNSLVAMVLLAISQPLFKL
jgi:hypothetical protein